LLRYASHVRRAIVALANHPDFREFDRDQSMQSDGKSMFSAEYGIPKALFFTIRPTKSTR
jgi:hypothetical protein